MTHGPEVWAGVECTVNRVGDAFFDQLRWSGHDRRADDLDRLAGLGVRTVRYPVLWERTQPDAARPPAWAWADERLGRLRALGVRPIVGLLHHGSGPRHTSLVDPGFPEELARYAAAVAGRYPWVDAYTPVNEPLTTARFSGLYGHWHPHGRDDRTFVRCLMNQCRGVALSMAAVRRVNPAAVLVQTEDLGHTHTHGGPTLRRQADFENERRWLTWDLLCGRVDRRHPLRRYLEDNGATDRELTGFQARPCPPGVVGVNYYVTSERYLDDRLHLYPSHTHGGNGRKAYVDAEAVRVLPAGGVGLAALLRQAARRYGLPVAVTEAHLGCTREDQVRWLAEVWRAAAEVRAAGLDVRAVTAWSAFGAFDWDSLVTQARGHYEPGLFDVRCDPPRPTAVANLVRDLAAGRPFDHPLLDAPGWWHRPERMHFGDAAAQPAAAPRRVLLADRHGPPFEGVCRARGLPFVSVAPEELDADPAAVLDACRPWAVLEATGSPQLAAACAARGVRFVTLSAGVGDAATEAERRVLAADPTALIARTPSRESAAVCHAALDLLADGEAGVWTVAVADEWAAPARAAGSAGLPDAAVGRPAGGPLPVS